MNRFVQMTLTGQDANQFLQGQLTINVNKIGDSFLPCAICSLKGRVVFGLWIKKTDNGFLLVMSADLAEDFGKHIKKYGAFSKITLSAPSAIYPSIDNEVASFADDDTNADNAWQVLSLKTANVWISKATTEMFQPQELRLHQRGGVDYDKGCYLGQEVVARLYFKASPKAFLHLIKLDNQVEAGTELEATGGKIVVVNSAQEGDGALALVVARPDNLAGFDIVSLPNGLNGDVARQK